MKPKVEFSLRKERDEIVFSQRITKRMKLPVAMKELKKMQQEKMQLEQQRMQVQKQIDEDILQQQLDGLVEQLDGLNKVDEDWQKHLTPVIAELKKKLVKGVKKGKKDNKYDEVENKTEKIILQNDILKPILEKLELDQSHELVREIKVRFDDI